MIAMARLMKCSCDPVRLPVAKVYKPVPAGRWSVCPAEQSTPELCNTTDDDCDGVVDEEVMCPDNAICRAGECVLPCTGGECPVGEQCDDGYCIALPCQACRAFEICTERTPVWIPAPTSNAIWGRIV